MRASLALASLFVSFLVPSADAQCGAEQAFSPTAPGPKSHFGRAVAMSDGLAAVAAEGFPGPDGTGGVSLFRSLADDQWAFVTTLRPLNPDPVNDFGAAVSSEPHMVVVGDPLDDDFGPQSGAVYVFETIPFGGFWHQTAKLHALDAGPGARFGSSVALEGNELVIGAPGAKDLFGVTGVGAAYVFERGPFTPWSQVARLDDPLGKQGDATGTSVAISGTHVLVGAPGQDAFGPDSGAVYAAERVVPGVWLPTAKLAASNAAPGDAFGMSVALAGGLAVIGAPGKNALCQGCGAAYVFASAGLGGWLETAKLADSGVAGELTGGDGFGTAVGISGETIAVSAPGNVVEGAGAGSVYLFQNGSSGYLKTSTQNGCATASGDRFGQAVSMNAGVLLTGAPGVDAPAADVGSAYLFSSHSTESIQILGGEVAIYFSHPEAVAASPVGGPLLDPQCAELPLYPQVEIEDRADANPLYQGHRYILQGRVWELDLIEVPIDSGFTFGGYDPSQAAAVFHGTPADCDPDVDFDVEYGYRDPETAELGTLATFTWTDCMATNSPAPPLGPFEVVMTVFLPDDSPEARFDLSAVDTGPSTEWSFWCGKLNLSMVEDHSDPDPDLAYYLLTPFGHLVKDPALNLVGQGAIPPRADAMGRPSNQALGFYDHLGRGLYAAMQDETGNRAKNFQFYGCPGGGPVDPRVSIVSMTFQDEVVAGVEFHAVPSSVGRFRGDWYDLAQIYRDWNDSNAAFLSQGPVLDRTDVPAFAKRLQMAGVISAAVESYAALPAPSDGPSFTDVPPPPGGLTTSAGVAGSEIASGRGQPTLPDRLQTYMEHYDIDDLIVLQFATNWTADGFCEGIGQYDPSALFQYNARLMQDKEDELAADGRELKFMVYFLDVLYSTLAPALDWEELVMERPGGSQILYTLTECSGAQHALIDPSTPEWQSHVSAAASNLGALGIDGIYCDNAFPDLREYDFSTEHDHPPGFGSYLTEGYADMFDAIQAGGASGNPGADPDFITYTEFFFEGFIPRSDTYGPEQAQTDWMTADANTVTVPLTSTLYHDYTILGPPFVGTFTHDIPPFSNQNHVLNLLSPTERADGRRSANFTMAYGWVNGCPIWCPDPGFANPLKKRFSFELQESDLGLPAGTLDELRAVCDFGAKLARTRGFPLAQPSLMVGRRLRDFGDFATTPASQTVELAQIQNPYAPIVSQLGPETETFPTILHGVWKDLDTGYIGVALANYTTAGASATFTFDPAEHDLVGPLSAYAVSASGETPFAGPFTGATVLSVSLAAEDVLVLRIHP